MKKIDSLIFAKDIKPLYLNGKNIGYEFKYGQYLKPYEAKELPEWNHNFSTCETCANNQKELIKDIEKEFQKFPNCCDNHTKLISQNWYNKKDFEGVPTMVVNKYFFCYFQILQYIDKDNWNEKIFDYLDYTIDSFGMFPAEFGEPFKVNWFLAKLKDLLEQDFKISTLNQKDLLVRKNAILKYLKTVFEPHEPDFSSLNILIKTYGDWLKVFPFEVEELKHLKKDFENRLPIIKGVDRVNEYSGKKTYKIYTKETLVDVLNIITKNLISKVDFQRIIQGGDLKQLNEVQIQILNAELKAKTESLVSDYSKGELNYIKVLKNWLKYHKAYFNQIKPLLKESEETCSEYILIKNRYPHIFKDDFGFTLFTKMFEFYKDEGKHLANFSFLFYAMEKEFLVCKQVDFIRLLENEEYNIFIDKIDSRQIGSPTKTKLYNSVKDNIFKKHRKSTI